jgi:hypothetical protein
MTYAEEIQQYLAKNPNENCGIARLEMPYGSEVSVATTKAYGGEQWVPGGKRRDDH